MTDLTKDSKYSFRFKNQTQALSNMIDTFMSTNNMVNDFTEGSISRSLFESVSIELEQLYYLTLENMYNAIDTSVTDAFGFTTKEATYAFGDLTISFSNTLTSDVYIPQGARFYSSLDNYNQVYHTIQPYRIPKGNNSYTITVYCTEKGTVGNIPSGIIDSSLDFTSINSVTNLQAFMTGTDAESSEDSKERFRKMIASLAHGTRNSLQYAALSVEGVDSCYIYEDNYGEVIVYVCDANGNLSDELKEKVSEAVSIYKPAGVRVLIRPIYKSYVNVSIGVQVGSSLLHDTSFLNIIKNNIENYLNNYSIGEYLHTSDIVQKVMDIEDLGIVDCDVTTYISTNEGLSTDDYISDNSPVLLGSTEVSQNQLVDPDIYQNATYGMIGLPSYTLDEISSPSWESALSANYVLNAGFHKDTSEGWDTFLGGHDLANISDNPMYGNSKSLCLNIEDNGRNSYRYVETNRVSATSGTFVSARAQLRASNLEDNGAMVLMFYSNYDEQKDLVPVPVRPKGASYNLLQGTSPTEKKINSKDNYGYWNTIKGNGSNDYTFAELGLESGGTYTYSIYVNNAPCVSYADVVLIDNEQHKNLEFKSKVVDLGYSGYLSVTFTIPSGFNANSISLCVKSQQDLGKNPNIPYMRLYNEKLEAGDTRTAWYLSSSEVSGKPQYYYNGTSITGTSDTWVASTIEGVCVPQDMQEVSIRFYVESFGIMYIAQPQLNLASTLAPFRINMEDNTPQYQTPYTDFYELTSGKYITAPNEILRANNVNVYFID